MKRKSIFILVLIPLFLVSCTWFSGVKTNQPLDDAQMATRVAQLLSTMTTPTSEIVFPPTATLAQPTLAPTMTQTPVVLLESPTPAGTVEVGGELSTPTASIAGTVAENTAAPEPTLEPSPTPGEALPASDPVNTLGSPKGEDVMDSNVKWAWPTGSDDFVSVEFKDGYLLMTNTNKDAAGWRLPMLGQQINSYIETSVNSGTCSNKDSYGIIFRVPVLKSPDQGYLFQVTCDGYYRLWKWDGKVDEDGQATSLINWKQSPEIKSGANQVNRLGVMVVNQKITLYINGVKVGETSDSSFSAGFIGAFVRSGASGNYTAKFDSMRYWEVP